MFGAKDVRSDSFAQAERSAGEGRNAAYADGGIAVGAVQPCLRGILKDNPRDRVLASQSLEVGGCEVPPPFLCFLFLSPVVRQHREERDRPAVLVVVGKHAALSDGPESVVVNLGNGDVSRIEREDGVFGSIVAGPEE